ncbi:MarR family winged helix-turn-helix transcriptional regulator [Sphingorhabdus sp.]|uniref:MarR family winged helix-turn-helix transcriptional regulator n=1 Tax=Sphingorhabdus sp. TaxID=1902408 RepID=UPI0037C8C5B6
MSNAPVGPKKSGAVKLRAAVSVPGRFYTLLAGAEVQTGDARQQYRRQTMALLQAISSRLQKIAAAHAAQTGLHVTDLFVMGLIYRTTDDHIAHVADVQHGLGITAGGMTRRLDSMVSSGLVERIPDPKDGRAWRVQLTNAGTALAEKLYASAEERNNRLHAEFNQKEWSTLIRLLKRLDGTMA